MNPVAPAVLTDAYPAQSPLSMKPSVLPPLAPAWPATCTPDCDVNDSASIVPPGGGPVGGAQLAVTMPAVYLMPPSSSAR